MKRKEFERLRKMQRLSSKEFLRQAEILRESENTPKVDFRRKRETLRVPNSEND